MNPGNPVHGARTNGLWRHTQCSFGLAIAVGVVVFLSGCDLKNAGSSGNATIQEARPVNPQLALLTLDPKDVRAESGLAFVYPAPQLASEADLVGNERRSPYFLMEDGKLLGPAHAIHEDIRKNGKGRWSHWSQYIYFSSSDGSDPRQNNRKYVLVK